MADIKITPIPATATGFSFEASFDSFNLKYDSTIMVLSVVQKMPGLLEEIGIPAYDIPLFIEALTALDKKIRGEEEVVKPETPKGDANEKVEGVDRRKQRERRRRGVRPNPGPGA